MSDTIASLLAEAGQQLTESRFGLARREGHLLLGHVLGLTEASLLARGEQVVGEAASSRFRGLLARRLEGEPAAYLLGAREFYGRPFFVDSRVLIPRPETEHLVEAVLERRDRLPARPRLLDLGTGSGCLAVTLLAELPTATGVAVDLSVGALAVAVRNARSLGVADRLGWVAGDLATRLVRGTFDVIVSNPPYVARGEEALLSAEILDYEPHAALFAPQGGLELVLAAAALADRQLAPGGIFACEIGEGQAEVLPGRLRQVAPGLRAVDLRADYAGKPRLVILNR